MNPSEASSLLVDAVPVHARRGTWADLGSGDGTFTRALAELVDADCHIYAVDRDAQAIASLNDLVRDHPNVRPVAADFTGDFTLPDRGDANLSGLLFANSLHYVKNPDAVLRRLVELLEPSGRVVVIEYDRRGPNQWVPFPIPMSRVDELFANAGLEAPAITATRPSRYGGDLYVASAKRG